MNNALKDLTQCGDVGSLQSALRTLCAEFGSVSHLDIMTMIDAGKRQAVCLLRLDSSEQEQNLMAKLGAGRFGEDLCVVVDLRMPGQMQA
jgi:hypothetical protein